MRSEIQSLQEVILLWQGFLTKAIHKHKISSTSSRVVPDFDEQKNIIMKPVTFAAVGYSKC